MATSYNNTDFIYRKFFGSAAQKKRTSQSYQNAQGHMSMLDASRRDVALTSILLPHEPGYIIPGEYERTYQLSQSELLSKVDVGSKKKALILKLPYGPYHVDFSPNGRYMLMGGEKGQLSMMNMHTYKGYFDISARETIRDLKVLHNHTMIAVEEVPAHLRRHRRRGLRAQGPHGRPPNTLSSPTNSSTCTTTTCWHRSASSANSGESALTASYQDVSTGEIVAKHATRKGPCYVMCQNKNNAVIHLGHNDGLVSLYVPNMAHEVVKMLCHKGPVTTLTVHNNYMVTSGFDGFWKIWDLRNYQECVTKQYFGARPPTSSAVSHTGILAFNVGGRVEFYTHAFDHVKPTLYIKHQFQAQEVKSLAFQPYEDVCAVGTTFGVSTLIVPGSGQPNFDSLEPNPYETGKVAKDREVQRLLEKLAPDTITLNTQPIGSYARELSTVEYETEQQPATDKKRRTRKRPEKTTAKYKVSTGLTSQANKYNRTFARRQQAVADRIRSLKEAGTAGTPNETKETILRRMTNNDVVKGPVQGAALSRFYKGSD